ncbi:tripartite motif-containing protein 3-like [Haemaphysalis longicornis]
MRMPCCSAEWSGVAALCQDCNRFICRNCASAHRSMLFKNHRVLSMEKCQGATGGEQPAADEEGTDQPVCEEDPVERTSAELQRSLESIRLMSRQLRESYDRAQEEVGKTFQFFIAALEERREKMLGDLRDLYGARMASFEALERKVRDCIEHMDRLRVAVEPGGSGSAEVPGLEQRLDSTAAALQSFLPQMERRSKELDFKFSQKAIEEGVRMFFGQVQAGQQPEASGPSGTQDPVSAVIRERGHALHQDGAEPLRPGDLSELSLACSTGEPSPHPSRWGGGGDAHQGPPIAPLTCRMRREKMILYHKFGSLGVKEGEFCEPSGVAVNFESDIIVADANNHRVQVFDRDGRFKFQFGQVGLDDGKMYFPSRVAVSRTTGDIIVIERAPAHQVQVFHRSGRFVRKFGSLELKHPRAVAVDPRGRLVVVECHVMRVVIFDQSGNLLREFVCSDELTFPNGVAVNEKEEIFISDNLAHCVKVFSYAGAYLRQIGGAGVTNFPVAVCVGGAGEVLVADNHRGFKVTLFTQDGALLKAYESNTKYRHCFDVAWMGGGTVVLASRDAGIHMYRFAEDPQAPADPSPPLLPVPLSSLLFHLVGR